MITTQVGWAVAVDHNGYPFAVVKTVNGGWVWREAGPPRLRGQGLQAAFDSARAAWVTWNNPRGRGWPITYQTTNGGRAWRRMGSVPAAAAAGDSVQRTAIGATAPDMVTGRLGWVTAGLGVAGGSSGMAIFRTTDAGASWRLIELTDPSKQTPGAIPFGCDKGPAVFSSARTGWVTGSCAGGRPAFWVSHDGGQTWRYQPLLRPSGAGTLTNCQCGLTPPVFTSPEDGALWVSDLPTRPPLSVAAYLTHNGGRTWRPIHLPGGRVPLQTPDLVNGQQGFVIGGRLPTGVRSPRDVRLYATANGGATWIPRSANPLLGQATPDFQGTLDFVTPTAGFASAISYNPFRSHLLETSDAGATWTSVPARFATSSPLRSSGPSGPTSPSPSRPAAATGAAPGG